MKFTFTLFFIAMFCYSAQSQTLTSTFDLVDPSLTWPWNWDIATDQDRIVTVNEKGTLNIKENGSWENIEIDANNPDLEPRGLVIADDGTIWFTTLENGLWKYTIDNEFVNFNTSNSQLPLDELRSIDIYNETLWLSTSDGQGLIRYNINSGAVLHLTSADFSDLKTDFNLDPHIDNLGSVFFSNRECLSIIDTMLNWENEDMRFYISGGRVKDIHFVSDTEVWIAMDGGLVLYDGSNYEVVLENQFVNYLQVFKDSKGYIWLSDLGEGVSVFANGELYPFYFDDDNMIPSQIFEFVEHQDTILAVGLLGNNIAKLTFDIGTSTSDVIDNTQIQTFPNPASSTIQITKDFHVQIDRWSIYDHLGKKVLEDSFSNNTIDVSDLAIGRYSLLLETAEGTVVKEVVISR